MKNQSIKDGMCIVLGEVYLLLVSRVAIGYLLELFDVCLDLMLFSIINQGESHEHNSTEIQKK